MNKVVFIGSKKFGLSVLEKMYSLDSESLIGVITLDDSKDDRSVLSEFQNYCDEQNLDFYMCNNKKDFNKVIEDWKPDLCIVAGWYWIIQKEVLDSVPHGFIGVHYSGLPRYRGWAPAVWQMINGEKSIWYSVFYLSKGMDSGDLLHTDYVVNKSKDYIVDILKKLENSFLVWLDKNYLLILEDSIIAVPQNELETEPTYCARRYPFDGEIDWKKPAVEIYNFIRAQSKPYPGAFTYYNGEKLTIWSVKLTSITYYGNPGQVAKVDDSGVWVVCGDNKAIILGTIQLVWKEECLAIKVLKSFTVRLGGK